MRDTYQEFKYRNIMTEDLVAFFNKETGRNWTPIFDQYLRHADLPTLELTFNDADGTVSYRWKADEKDFAMPIRVGKPGAWQTIQPTTEWKKMSTPLKKDEFAVATDLYYVNVSTNVASGFRRDLARSGARDRGHRSEPVALSLHFAPWKNGPSAACLTVRRRLGFAGRR